MSKELIKWLEKRKQILNNWDAKKLYDVATKEISELTNFIRKCNFYYYVKNKSFVSDAFYDKSYIFLQKWETKIPQLLKNDSPTQIITSNISKSVRKEPHSEPMLSIDNSFTDDDIEAFLKRVFKRAGKCEYIMEPKIDGLSLVLVYQKGNLVTAKTRGDGKFGEIVTKNILTCKMIPQKLNLKINIEVRGEAFLPKSDFNKLLKKRNVKFGNQRNIASGLVRSFRFSEEQEVEKNFLVFLPYIIINPSQYNLKSQEEVLLFLNKIGFITDKYWKKVDDFKQLIDYFNVLKKMYLKEIDYYLDGVVIKVNNFIKQKELGHTTKFPRWAIAYKFSEETQETQLLSIRTTIGRTGKVTFVGTLKKTLLDNTFVSRVTLNNKAYIKKNDIKLFDWILIKKSGGIIPKFLKVNKARRKANEIKEISFPKKCPFCGEKLFDNGKEMFCYNYNSIRQITMRMIHFCSKNALNIMGFGDEIIHFLVKNKIIINAADIFKLEQRQKEIFDLQKERKIMSPLIFSKLNRSINLAKNTKLKNILFGLGIHHAGIFMCGILANKFKSIDAIMQLTKEQIISLKGIGEIAGNSFYNFIQSKKNQAIILDLKKSGLKFTFIEKIKSDHFFNNKNILISGSFKDDRKAILKLIENVGGINKTTINKTIDLFFVGNKCGQNKINFATKNNIKIYSEADFWQLLKSSD